MPLLKSSFLLIVPFGLILLCLVVLVSCNNRSNKQAKEDKSLTGEKLARIYCQSCHKFPEPALLNKKSWEQGVLPHMGPLLGVYEFNYQRYPSNLNDINLPKGFYPSKPLVNPAEWQKIIDYYVTSSPDTLPAAVRKISITRDLPLFTPEIPSIKYNDPSTSFVKIRQQDPGGLIACDLYKQAIFRFDKRLGLVDSMFSSGAIVDIDFQNQQMLTCNIGIFNPTNNKYGEARYIRKDSTGNFKKEKIPLFNNLLRPVQIMPADINNDGKTDYVICEFGYMTGSLSWMESVEDGKFVHHDIRQVPGATRAYSDDYNDDGLADLWVLFAQGDEGVFLFTNKGNGQFKQEEVLSFPPSYGSSYFELCDFNKDGHADILYTCGDNADYSNVLKPYHGVYIFLNDGKNHFTEQYFFPLNGCYKAVARDFDNDGDLDIAAIAYFPDYANQPQEGFVYLKNEGSFSFRPFTTAGTEKGRWMTMDAGDIDGDGDIDLVLGNFSLGPELVKSKINFRKEPPFLVLRNKMNK